MICDIWYMTYDRWYIIFWFYTWHDYGFCDICDMIYGICDMWKYMIYDTWYMIYDTTG